MPDPFSLEDRVALVTGGGRGIGRAIATEFGAAGASVVPMARSSDEIEAVAASIRNDGGSAQAIQGDVTDHDDIESAIEATLEAYGQLDVVVTNAGINPRAALGRPNTIDRSALEEVLAVNLAGAADVAETAAEALTADGGGTLITVASVGGVVGLPRQHPYVASKHGLLGLTKALALDWAPDVRVNAIAPGYVATELTAELRETDHVRTSILGQTPLERFADPEEIAQPVRFLASDAASFLTGSVLAADGGWTAR